MQSVHSPADGQHLDIERVVNLRHRFQSVTWLALAAACSQDAAPPTVPSPTGAGIPAAAAVASGDNQQADPTDQLDDPVVFRVTDKLGNPVAGAVVEFATPIGGGSVPYTTATTDSLGTVATNWTMGPFAGVQSLQLVVKGAVLGTATATTCDPATCFPPVSLAGTMSAATLLSIATYDASGQAVHPDVVRSHGASTGFWLALTPYPGGNSSYENPSIFRSRDATNWSIPKGVKNPLTLPPSGSYLSDPDLVVNADQSLWMYYRAVIGGSNVIDVMRSGDGHTWSAPVTVVTVPSHTLVSPAVVRRGTAWQMWSVNAGSPGCSAASTTIERRTSGDGLTWSSPTTVALVQPGQNIWHIDVQWVPARAEYWAVYNTYPAGRTCTTDALWLARSSDGVHWTTYPSPIARAGVISQFSDIIYRSTFMVSPAATKVSLWMSGASYVNGTYAWGTARVSILVSDLIAIASAPAANVLVPRFRQLPPPEPDVGPDH